MSHSQQMIIPGAEPFFFSGKSIGCLLVHGFTGTPKEMRILGEFLHGKGYSVLGIRLAGHATTPLDMVRTKWHDWLLSVEDGIHFLRQTCEKIFVIGLSMGGMLTLIASSRYAVNGAVIISTLYQLPRDWRLSFINLLKVLMPSVKKGPSDWYDPENAIDHKEYPRYPTASIGELKKVVEEMHRCTPEVSVPVLLVQSTADATVPEEHVHMLFRDLRSSDKQVVLVHHSGHVVTEDTDRDIAFEKIYQFIQRISSTRSF